MERQKVTKSVEQRAKDFHENLAKLACYHRMSPHAFCDGSFTEVIHMLDPVFPSIKFETIESNCLKVYQDEKIKVKEAFSKFDGLISLSVDFHFHEKLCHQYLCLSAHFIDDDWKLRKWVIGYYPLPYEAIVKSLKDYGIESKILSLSSCNLDSANFVKENVEKQRKLPMNGQLFHVHCSCISRMAQVGFDEIGDIIDKVQSLSWSNSKPLWYLTTSKLLYALKLEAMGKFSAVRKCGCTEVPSKKEWEKVRKLCQIAERIYKIVEGLFEHLRPTPNLFLPHLQEIRVFLTKESSSSDAFVRLVVKKMLDIFNKYWDDMCLLLSITAFLDPRYKMKFIEYCPDDSRAGNFLENIRKVYDDYEVQCDQKEYPLSDCSDSEAEEEEEDIEEGSETQAKKKHSDILQNLSLLKDYCQSMQSEDVQGKTRKSDLDFYLEDPVLPWVGDFSVLHWWKDNGSKYPQLSRMARDFFAIPMSVATLNDAYYTEQRLVHHSLMSLTPKLVNALKCTRSWKLGAKKKTQEAAASTATTTE